MDQGLDDLYKCQAPQNRSGADMVLGGDLWSYPNCLQARVSQHACGPTGLWFEPKPVPATVPVSGPAGEATIEDLEL